MMPTEHLSSNSSEMFTAVSLNVSSISPTTTPTASPADQLTAMMITFSSLVVFVLIVLLGSLIYRKDPFCCKSQAYHDSHADLESSSQHYSSRQTLVGPPFIDSTQNIEGLNNINPQSEQLFCVGMPSTYCLPPMDTSMPHLPSYESVRKKDRQRQIHLMIADRFGLNGPMEAENPPTYEESVRQSLQSLQALDAPFDPVPPPVMPQAVLSEPPSDLPPYEELPQTPASPDSNNDPDPEEGDK